MDRPAVSEHRSGRVASARPGLRSHPASSWSLRACRWVRSSRRPMTRWASPMRRTPHPETSPFTSPVGRNAAPMFRSSSARVSTIVPAASGARRSRGMGPAAADRGLVAATGGTGADAAARAAGAAAPTATAAGALLPGTEGVGDAAAAAATVAAGTTGDGSAGAGDGAAAGGVAGDGEPAAAAPAAPTAAAAAPAGAAVAAATSGVASGAAAAVGVGSPGPQQPLPRCPHPPPPRPQPVSAPPPQARRTRRRSDRRPRPPPSTSDRRRPRRPGNGTARPWARWSPCPPVDRIAGRLLPVVPRRQVSRAPPRRPYAAVSHGLALVEHRIARGRGHPDRPGGSLRS